jgi:putative hydrolase of the HAD superfamily
MWAVTLPTVVLFDLDGTLFDHIGSARSALDAWLPLLGARATNPLVAAWFNAETEHLTEWLEGLISFDEQRRRRLRDFLPIIGLPVGRDEELDEMFGGYLRSYEAAWRAYDDAHGGLSGVHGLGLATAVFTNGSTEQQRAKLAMIGLEGLAGPVITAEELGIAKPHSEAFALACSRLDLLPADVLYVGDNHVTDVLAARAAGLRTVYLDREGAGPLTERSRITTLHDLSSYLIEVNR